MTNVPPPPNQNPGQEEANLYDRIDLLRSVLGLDDETPRPIQISPEMAAAAIKMLREVATACREAEGLKIALEFKRVKKAA